MTVRITQIGKRNPTSHRRRVSLEVSVGRPNYAERQFIRDCKKAGVRFPVSKVQYNYYRLAKKATKKARKAA